MRTLFKLRALFLLLAFLLLGATGGLVANAAAFHSSLRWIPFPAIRVEGTPVPHEGHPSSGGTEPSPTAQVPEPTATTPPPEPTPLPKALWSGTITAVDCSQGSLSLTLDEGQGAASAQLTNQTRYLLSGQPGTCSGLNVGWHVTVEAQQHQGGWIALTVAQDDRGQPVPGTGSGDGHTGSGDGTGSNQH